MVLKYRNLVFWLNLFSEVSHPSLRFRRGVDSQGSGGWGWSERRYRETSFKEQKRVTFVLYPTTPARGGTKVEVVIF